VGESLNIDDVLSGRPGRSGNWAVELGGPKTFRTNLHVTLLNFGSVIAQAAQLRFRFFTICSASAQVSLSRLLNLYSPMLSPFPYNLAYYSLYLFLPPAASLLFSVFYYFF
jgi:hypothetical protein